MEQGQELLEAAIQQLHSLHCSGRRMKRTAQACIRDNFRFECRNPFGILQEKNG